MLLQAARLDLPALLAEARGRVGDLGVQERGGLALRALLVPMGGGIELTAFVDERTHRILRSEGQLARRPDGPPRVLDQLLRFPAGEGRALRLHRGELRLRHPGRLGLSRNLSAEESVAQYAIAGRHLREMPFPRNVAFMGMGEPPTTSTR